MSMMLSRAERQRLAKVLGLLSSNHVGERATAASMAHQILVANNMTWDDLLMSEAPAPTPRAAATPRKPASTADMTIAAAFIAEFRYLDRHRAYLTQWEADFIASLMTRRMLTTKQTTALAGVVRRVKKLERQP